MRTPKCCNFILRVLFISVIMCGFVIRTASQNDKGYVFPQKVHPAAIEKYAFSGYYYNGRNVYNLRQSSLSKSRGEVLSMKINPSGTSYAVLSKKDNNVQLKIYDLWRADEVVHTFSLFQLNPISIAYSPDSKSLAVAFSDCSVELYDARSYVSKMKFGLSFPAKSIAISDNNYFMAVLSDNYMSVFNMEDGTVRYATETEANFTSLAFSSGSEYFVVCTDDGKAQLYDTGTFSLIEEFDSLGNASDCDFHPNDKYIAVVVNDKAIAMINRYDSSDREYVNSEDGGISDLCFVKDEDDNVYLLHNTESSITYYYAGALAPNYTSLLSDELDDRLQNWMKRMDGETMEEYNLRVNEETRNSQTLFLEQEIATELAGNLLEMSTISLGGYNQETNMLALDFNTMPSIYLNVPENRLGEFSEVEKLDFRNPRYGLTTDDKFELVYLEVYNMDTGSLAVFDNRNRNSLTYLNNDSSFVPLEVVQVSSMEEIKLGNIKNEVVTLAKAGKIISDHTNISVNTRVSSTKDASGNKILNYCVGFSYNVEAAFSSVEDFGPGKYHIKRSGAAMSMLKIITKAFETDFAQYLKPGKKVKIKITGMADMLRVTGVIPYDGVYGNFIDEPVYGKDLMALTVTKESGISTNEQLAFIRAAGVKEMLDAEIDALSEMMTEYEYHIQLMDKVGGQYRRISVEFNFIDAF